MIDFRDFIKNAEDSVRRHSNGNGTFRRCNSGNEGGDACGCADAINILYTLNVLPKSYSGRAKYIKALQALQNPETGMFTDEEYDSFYTTAYCTAALELLDSHPVYPLSEMLALKEPDKLVEFMENQPWSSEPLMASHRIASLYSALTLTGCADSEWQKAYFSWLHNNTDGDTGLIRSGFINYRKTPPFRYLSGTVRYMFGFEYRHLPMRYPARIIDTCIQFYDRKVSPDFGKKCGFEEMDWVYCMNRSMRRTDYRYKDCKARLKELESVYSDYILGLDFNTDSGLNDMHTLFGVLCTVAELQSALPGTVLTDKPMRLILDRCPFI